ncbi:hypothetical protein I79_023943 [Cricetulus griseus]|uniref:Uncharacterized protein n=1 Tax=Cricetulus griseus TaxID=10029 RepID=G3IJB0_CRIGR|nr:hypothetical protein I79_023943 [Cricetulus griseus]
MQTRLLTRQLGHTLGGAALSGETGCFAHLQTEAAALGNPLPERRRRSGPVRSGSGSAGRGREGMQRPEPRTEAVPLPSGR